MGGCIRGSPFASLKPPGWERKFALASSAQNLIYCELRELWYDAIEVNEVHCFSGTPKWNLFCAAGYDACQLDLDIAWLVIKSFHSTSFTKNNERELESSRGKSVSRQAKWVLITILILHCTQTNNSNNTPCWLPWFVLPARSYWFVFYSSFFSLVRFTQQQLRGLLKGTVIFARGFPILWHLKKQLFVFQMNQKSSTKITIVRTKTMPIYILKKNCQIETFYITGVAGWMPVAAWLFCQRMAWLSSRLQRQIWKILQSSLISVRNASLHTMTSSSGSKVHSIPDIYYNQSHRKNIHIHVLTYKLPRLYALLRRSAPLITLLLPIVRFLWGLLYGDLFRYSMFCYRTNITQNRHWRKKTSGRWC